MYVYYTEKGNLYYHVLFVVYMYIQIWPGLKLCINIFFYLFKASIVKRLKNDIHIIM